ncbi:MAG TPA: arginase family protein [Candidatus Dormibacteraeota bacterium]|nr:arginase family protein [Candidatus Dormibacteraeota bacterium]
MANDGKLPGAGSDPALSQLPRGEVLNRLGLIGVPSSAGAHGPGQEKAPSALRNAGLLGALREAGLEVEDLGDLPVARFTPDRANRKRQSQPRVVKVARQVADAVAAAVERDLMPLVLGGDCTITLGVVAGLVRRQPDLGLIYFDGDADLTTPETTHSGIFDSMGVAHLIGEGDPELAHIGPRFPLLTPDRIALFGFQPYEVEPRELLLLEESAIPQYPVTSLDDRPVEFAAEARARLEERARAVAVHFDVDVMDSAEIPLANWPHYDALSFGDAMRCLSVFVGSPKLAALVVTEINPDHDPDGLMLRQFIDAFADALRPVAASVG